MLVVSMSDFLRDPKRYMERARHTPLVVEDAGETSVEVSAHKPSLFAKAANLFKPKERPIGLLEGKASAEFIGGGEVTPEELFDDDDEDFLTADSDALKQG